MKKSTLTIGVPAFNEEQGIGGLLTDLLAQDFSDLTIQIIVASDASTDQTVAIAKGYKSKLIKVVDRKVRGGKAAVINQISKSTASDVLVILDADTRLPDPKFIKNLIAPILADTADLTAADEQFSKPRTHFEKILATSVAIKRQVFLPYNSGQNFYTCHGQARAFSKKLYTKLVFPFSAGEDLYSYIFCVTNGFTYRFVPQAVVHFRLPTKYADHERQSVRFAQAVTKINNEFGTALVKKLTHIPWSLVIKHTTLYAFKHPFAVLINIFVFGMARVRSTLISGSQNTWTMVTSSKKLS